MRIVYAAAVCSETAYAELFRNSDSIPSFQAQKYNRLFAEGLSAHTRVDLVGYPPIEPEAVPGMSVRLPDETANGVRYHYLRAFRGRFFRRLWILLASFFQCLRLLDSESVLITDCLNQMSALGGILAARLKGCRCVGIVTDLPEFIGFGAAGRKLFDVSKALCTDYIFLTEAMNARLNSSGKPHVVLEGHADIAMREKQPDIGRKAVPRIVLYAGSIHEIYGISRLVEGFRKAALPDTRLVVYGSGDYVDRLREISRADPSVFYGGLLLPSQVVEEEMSAVLLVNPRPSDAEFVKYSFPSKTMEYMSTGTPLLTTDLPGLPEEYRPHVFLIKDETPDGIARALRETLARSDEELFAFGCEAREFILRERNNEVQAGKVLAMLTEDRG